MATPEQLESTSAAEHKQMLSLLVVDDEGSIRSALRRFLTQQGYTCHVAASGEEALKLIRLHKIACVILDVRLPGVSGIDLVPTILEVEPNAAVLMLTAVNDATSAALCMQRGAIDYLTKPVDLSDLERAIERALEQRARQIDAAQITSHLKEEVAIRTAELRLERANLQRISVATLEALVNALEAKDPYLRGHSMRVADLAAATAAEFGLADEDVALIRTAGRLHDIGMIAIREDVLNKQGPLTNDEFVHVKSHAMTGAQILEPLTHLRPIVGYVRGHHERWDGRGYPDGLAGEAIPVGARIIGAVEIFDALTTSRPYQEKMPSQVAIERLGDLTGTVIDPSIHRALATVVAQWADDRTPTMEPEA